MFDHVTIHASDRGASERFYGFVLSRLDIAPTSADTGCASWNDLRILAADGERPATRNLHAAALAAGSDERDAEAPAEGPQGYTTGARDPDGGLVQSVHHGTRTTAN
ncbi:MAG TPA: hypothetical protein VK655_10720 [Solirubrobacteraceae bacterium]|jgi:hypothetical protein|nr:hypothetical protein [Solirubrobacteraceae bacterium]